MLGGNGYEMRKAWGETLDGGNGAEPGAGYDSFVFFPKRKLGPLNRRSDREGAFSPGYNHVFNNGVPNTYNYFWDFFDASGNNLSAPGPIFFPGLSAGSTSFTYIDGSPVPLVQLAPLNQSDFISSRFEHNLSGTTGINAIGGYLYSWEQGNWFLPPPLTPPGGGKYAGPGDVVPSF